MDKNELRRQIQKTEELFERRKEKRMIFTILLYSAVNFWIIYLLDKRNIESLMDIIGLGLGSIFLGFIVFFFNAVIWSQLWQKSQDEKDALNFLKKMLEQKEREEKRNHKELSK